ncbi:hypothetical protein A0J61_08686 [Choanephora cucurbitarum]|uniref:Uncharacterized protein n=1 Tax=Choanephora cucurbitarum TaxID=101091 RepID=A0A1C7N7G1_9FUNG|nr:hypothetical protein A0J61_08686 [Choanephora cucurbitarum]
MSKSIIDNHHTTKDKRPWLVSRESETIPSESEDIEDPINKLWGVIEPMMDKLSIDSQLEDEEKSGLDESYRIQHEMALISESFFLPPTSKEAKPTRKESLREENRQLKTQLAFLKSRIQNLEKGSVDHSLLKSNIVQFKNDVHRQMQRALQSQENASMTRSATVSPLSRNIRHVQPTTVKIVNRIKELEEANRTLRSQNRKQDALMNKYRERWEKLKEGAKRRQPNASE